MLPCWVEGGFGALSSLSWVAKLCPWCPAGHVPLVSLLINYYAGLDLERRDQRGLTALMKAAMRDRSECVAALLMAGAWGLNQDVWSPVPPSRLPTRH